MHKLHPRLGVVLSTVTDASPDELVALGQLAEQLDYEAVLVNEGRSDALALSQAIAQGRVALDDPALLAHLWQTTLDRLAVDQPGYASYQAELARCAAPGTAQPPSDSAR